MIRDALLTQLVEKQALLFENGTVAQRENVLMQIDARKVELKEEGVLE
jgi:hypothetical protein